MIFYEKDHAEKLLKNGLTSFMNYQDLSVLAKYFKYIGQNRIQIKQSLLDFCKKFVPNFNEILSRKKINDAIDTSQEYSLRLPIDVNVTESELDIIKSCGDYKRQKILFVMLVIAKYFKYNDTRLTPKNSGEHDNDFYVNDTFINVLKMAKVNVSRIERMNLLYDLEQSNLITTINPPRKNKKKKNNNNNISYRVNFIYDDSDTSIIVKDMNDIVKFYPFYCEKCGKEINKAKRHNLCLGCYEEKRKEIIKVSSRNYWRNKH